MLPHGLAVSITLVDHNRLARHQESFRPLVHTIIDHHDVYPGLNCIVQMLPQQLARCRMNGPETP
jgi:hypothetical protein